MLLSPADEFDKHHLIRTSANLHYIFQLVSLLAIEHGYSINADISSVQHQRLSAMNSIRKPTQVFKKACALIFPSTIRLIERRKAKNKKQNQER